MAALRRGRGLEIGVIMGSRERPFRSSRGPVRVVKTPPKSELESFASFFHQDWGLMEMDFYAGAAAYFESLSPERRAALRKQLLEFAEHRESQKALKKAWIKLGAAGWQKGLDMKQALQDFIAMLDD